MLLLLSSLLLSPPAPPAALPAVFLECETGRSYHVCGTWLWDGKRYSGRWQGGAIGAITIVNSDPNALRFTRVDASGTASGLTATYSGTWNGRQFTGGGKVSWSWNGKSDTVDWTGDATGVPVTYEMRDLGITNLYPANLTAFTVTEKMGDETRRVNEDFRQKLQAGIGPFGRGHPNLNPYAVIGHGSFQPTVIAALFSDGTAIGDPKSIDELIKNREGQLNTFQALAQDLRGMVQRGGLTLTQARDQVEARHPNGGVETEWVLNLLSPNENRDAGKQIQQALDMVERSIASDSVTRRLDRPFAESAAAPAPHVEPPHAGAKVSAAVSEKLLRVRVEPRFMGFLQRAERIVVLEFTVTPAGDVTDITVLSSQPMISMQDNPDIFGHAASDAVRQWKYNPYLVNGQPAAMRTTTTIKFEPPH